MNIKYKRKKNIELPKYQLSFNIDNNWTVDVQEDLVDKILLNPHFEIVGLKAEPKEEKIKRKVSKNDR